jgi:hypothetical protein
MMCATPLRHMLAIGILSLTACASSSSLVGTPPVAVQPASKMMLPFEKSAKSLLYVSDSGTNGVVTFAWPKPATGIALSGSFSEPQGMCADQSSNVFITNTGDSNVLEYNGARLVNTLADSDEYPVGCSFNPLNGNIAVANIITTQDGAGSVSLYKNATGKPFNIPVKVLARVYSVIYDGSDDLYAEGENASYGPALAVLKAGSKQFKVACADLFGGAGGIQFPGAVGWDGKYMVLINNNELERIKNCKVVGHPAPFAGAVDIVSFTIVGDRLIAPDAGAAAVDIYSYPKLHLIQTLTGFSEPIGSAVSSDVKSK